MAFLDILRGRKREEEKPERLPKGALKRVERPAKKRGKFKIVGPGKKEKTEKTEPASAKASAGKKEEELKTKQSALAVAILLGPHITERTDSLTKGGIYTFKVVPSANKVLIKKAIKEMYGYEPIKVRIINAPSKKRSVRGKIGTKSGFKKAFVYLKESDKIDFV